MCELITIAWSMQINWDEIMNAFVQVDRKQKKKKIWYMRISTQIMERSKVSLWLSEKNVLAFAAAEMRTMWRHNAYLLEMIYSFGHFHVWKIANECKINGKWFSPFAAISLAVPTIQWNEQQKKKNRNTFPRSN